MICKIPVHEHIEIRTNLQQGRRFGYEHRDIARVGPGCEWDVGRPVPVHHVRTEHIGSVTRENETRPAIRVRGFKRHVKREVEDEKLTTILTCERC